MSKECAISRSLPVFTDFQFQEYNGSRNKVLCCSVNTILLPCQLKSLYNDNPAGPAETIKLTDLLLPLMAAVTVAVPGASLSLS
ncbi:hypothetical protein D3C72_1763030 [compost metagenome]